MDAKLTNELMPDHVLEYHRRHPYMQNRELSWLEFNKRCLEQGMDPTVPLFERLSFISIFWSNLREFFMIRVGSLSDLTLVKQEIIDQKSGMTPAEQIQAIHVRCHELYPYYEKAYHDLCSLLEARGISCISLDNPTSELESFLSDYFDTRIMPYLAPQIINTRHPFPHLENGAIYVVVRLDEDAPSEKLSKAVKSKSKGGKKKKDAKNVGAKNTMLGIIPLPHQCQRVIKLPGSGEGLRYVLLEQVIEHFVSRIFSMYKIKHTNVICVTRNFDLDATEGAEEQGEDYRDHMKRILKRRTRLAPVRLESARPLSAVVQSILKERLNLQDYQLYVNSVPLDMSHAYTIPSLVSGDLRSSLSYKPFTPAWPASLSRNRSLIEQVCEHEVLLSYPYESIEAYIQLLHEAAHDPDVESIKITFYRLAGHSRIAEALIEAAEAGKEVIALFELRARFDEANNIEYSQRFEEAGAQVIYGFHDLKVHSKISCITRRTDKGLQYITQLGTGNYNERTSRLYTDFSFFTTDPAIGEDACEFFRNMLLENASDSYGKIWVAPLQIKSNIMAAIDNQISLHRQGNPSGVLIKTNSVTDKELIDKIVEASQEGVKVTLLVRGISCIIPGIPGFTDNVRVLSIVGRLLEHNRIYCFGQLDCNPQIYLASADLMTRNMDKRVEIAWPVENEELHQKVLDYINTFLSDTAKLRTLLPNGEYTELRTLNQSEGTAQLIDSQELFIRQAQDAAEAAAQAEAPKETSRARRRTAEAPRRVGVHSDEAMRADTAREIEVPQRSRLRAFFHNWFG